MHCVGRTPGRMSNIVVAAKQCSRQEKKSLSLLQVLQFDQTTPSVKTHSLQQVGYFCYCAEQFSVKTFHPTCLFGPVLIIKSYVFWCLQKSFFPKSKCHSSENRCCLAFMKMCLLLNSNFFNQKSDAVKWQPASFIDIKQTSPHLVLFCQASTHAVFSESQNLAQ